MAKVYGYGYGDNRYFAQMSKKKFIKLVADKDKASVNWVKQRTSETGNSEELRRARKTPNKILRGND